MTDVQPDYTPFLNLVRPDTHDDIRTTVNKLRDALDAVDAWAQAHAGGGGLSFARQVSVDSSTPSAPDPDMGAYIANDVDLVVVDNTDGGAPFIDLPDSPIGTAITVVRRDIGGTNQSIIGVSTPSDSSWGFLNQPDSHHSAANLADGEAKTYVSNGVSGWWFIDANNTLPPPFYGSDPNNIDWTTLLDAKMLAFSGYTGKFYWTNLIPGITRGVHFSNGPVTETLPDGTRYVNAAAQGGDVTITLPSPQHGYFPEFGGAGEGLLITIWKNDQSANPITIVPPDGNPMTGDGVSPDGLSLLLTQYNESVTVVAWNNSWWVLEHARPGPRVITRTDNDQALFAGDVCLCDTSIRTFQVSLPPPQANARVVVKKTTDDAHVAQIFSSGGLIEGAGQYDLTTQGDSVTLICDGTDWWAEAIERGTPSTLNVGDLGDVQYGTRHDGEILRYNGTDGKWENVEPGSLPFLGQPFTFVAGSPTVNGDADLTGTPAGTWTVAVVDTTVRDAVVTMPAPEQGTVISVKKADASAHVVNVVTPGSETIDGAASLVISTQYQSRDLVSDGTNWWVV